MNEAAFAAALLDPAHPLPAGLIRPDGQPADRRFAVYRNTVAVSLTEALRAGFPVVETLVGPKFFRAMAGEFVRHHPPQGRIMMLYGDRFPQFLADFAPVSAYPYLADVAQVEQALRESYHAADSTALQGAALAALPEADWLAARVTLAPALRLVRSVWPVHGIWTATKTNGTPPKAVAEDVVILRPTFDPQPHVLPPGGGVVIDHLLSGATFADALSVAGPDLDLPALFSLLLSGGAITGFKS